MIQESNMRKGSLNIENSCQDAGKKAANKIKDSVSTDNEAKAANTVKVRALVNGPIPTYSNLFAAGLDLAYDGKEPLIFKPGDHKTVHTGFSLELPRGTFGLVVIRSSLGMRGLILSNGVGIIDEDYRGEIRMPLYNHGEEEIILEPAERVGQMIVMPYLRLDLEKADSLDETERNHAGFGSSGRF